MYFKLFLQCNNSAFNEKFYLQEDSTAMGSHMSCSYSGISMYRFHLKALRCVPQILFWKKWFKDKILAAWNHSLLEFHKVFKFRNTIDTSGKIKFTMSITNKDFVLEFLDLSLNINKHSKICIGVCAKPTNGFIYILRLNCYTKKNLNKVLKGIAMKLRIICDSDENFDIGSSWKRLQSYSSEKRSFTLLET